MILKSLCLVLVFIIAVKYGDCQQCKEVLESHRLDCAPDKPHDSEVCAERKCCYVKHNATNARNMPACFLPADYIGYKVGSIKKEATHITVTLERQGASGFPHEVKTVSIEITFLNDKSLRIKIVDPSKKRFEVPFPKLNLPKTAGASNPLYEVEVTAKGNLTIKRKSNSRTIFSTDLTQLIYSDQFLQLKSSLPSSNIYGIGEHKSPFLKSTEWKKYTLFNHDRPVPAENWPLYGSHPFHLNVEDSEGNSNGILLFNSNAMDIITSPQPSITWMPIGGVLDFFVFLGPKPNDVVREYVSLIGKPSLPPFWSLGYHQCRCCPSPHTLEEQKAIWKRTIDAGIPFDVQWNAKEYMVNFNDFTVDNKTFAGFGDWVKHLHEIGMHYVPIIDPGLDPAQPSGTYPPYDDGVKMDVFIKNASNHILIGKVWNKSGKTVWPDFSHPNATIYWTEQFKEFHKKVPIDGSWNDMNEISNFVPGSLDGCPKNSTLEHPPYLPGNRSLQDMTLCMTAKHHAGEHYNVHNLYGLYMAYVTNLALREVRQKRAFVISRATFVGQGKYSGHWDGDTGTTFDQMAWTIPSIMNFNLFGIPLVGGDICGFMQDRKNDSSFQELCSRWFEIGAFYPFSRNHNTKKVDQDPVALGPTVVKAAKRSLETRYTLLPYLYTLFYFAELNGDAVVRPLFFEFPNDKNSYGPSSETQFLWGSGFMIIPVVEEHKTTVKAYFPAGRWYPFSAHEDYKPIESKGEFRILEAPIGEVNTVVRGGTIIPSLPPKQTTTLMRNESFTVLVALNNDGKASGHLYWDSGDSLDPIEKGEYSLVSFNAENGILSTEPIHHKYDGKVIMENIKVLGLTKSPTSVTVNGVNYQFKYIADTEELTISKVNLSLVESKNSIVWK